MSGSKGKSKSWLDGVVHWFDKNSGEGLIKSKNGETYFVHYSAIESPKKWKALNENSPVKFQLIEDVTFVQVSKVKEA